MSTSYDIEISRTQQFWNEQAEWSEATFGKSSERGPLGALKHLEKEAREAQAEAKWILDNPGKFDGLLEKTGELRVEIADCLFLALDAARRSGMTLDELLDVAFAKLEVNKNRKWQRPTDDGPVEHVREGE